MSDRFSAIPPEVACPFCGGYVRGHQWIGAESCSVIEVFAEPVRFGANLVQPPKSDGE